MAAVSVPALADDTIPIQIVLAQVKGVRISGTAVSASGRPAAGMPVRLFRRFGGEGSEFTRRYGRATTGRSQLLSFRRAGIS